VLFVELLGGAWGAAIGAVVNTVVIFVLAESMPKTWAILHTERAGLATSRFTEALIRFWPLRIISRGLIGLTNVLLPGKGLKEGPFVSEQELLGIVEAAAEDEVIEHEERELIESIIEFGDTVAREVMVPRPDMITVPEDATITAALDVAIAHGKSRLPLQGGEDGDDIVGLVFAKDLMRAEREGRGDTPAFDLARPVRFIPENKPVARLMREMQAEKFHLAIVADEYGEVVGLITLEDCLEELVGEIVDEYDVESDDVQRQPDGDYIVDGGTPVDEVSELLGLELPDEEWETVGGFVFGTLEHVPEVGESVVHDHWRFTVTEVDGRRVRSVRISDVVAEDEAAAASGAGEVGAEAAHDVASPS
jgi:putative hemolysin